ncbi:MAG: 4-hydroxythreonine-4-phosphate dehydrogenase PdxA, partial [Chitinispirillaceae bacterium]|nr:4-hydroxythreonine-4-phosphate dehydrogenase PdxA [Chitinispirillaceae bacterium]
MKTTEKTTLFALTMGDPAGIGPEIALKAMKNAAFRDAAVVVGDAAVLEDIAARVGIRGALRRIASVADFRKGKASVLDCGMISPGSYALGRTQEACGRAAYRYIETAIELAMRGEVDGVITNPINKEALHAAGVAYPGHTEIFADKTGACSYSMLFLLHNVGVAHVTTHCSLRTAVDLIS